MNTRADKKKRIRNKKRKENWNLKKKYKPKKHNPRFNWKEKELKKRAAYKFEKADLIEKSIYGGACSCIHLCSSQRYKSKAAKRGEVVGVGYPNSRPNLICSEGEGGQRSREGSRERGAKRDLLGFESFCFS